jgi:hypothetical protein
MGRIAADVHTRDIRMKSRSERASRAGQILLACVNWTYVRLTSARMCPTDDGRPLDGRSPLENARRWIYRLAEGPLRCLDARTHDADAFH